MTLARYFADLLSSTSPDDFAPAEYRVVNRNQAAEDCLRLYQSTPAAREPAAGKTGHHLFFEPLIRPIPVMSRFLTCTLAGRALSVRSFRSPRARAGARVRSARAGDGAGL